MKIKKICKQCGREKFFMPSRAKKNKGFCSRKCMGENRIIRIKKTCPECGKIYLAENQNERRRFFCSPKCSYANRKKQPSSRKQYFETNCAYCNKQLFRWRFELKRKHSFCNSKCQINYYKKIQEKRIIPLPLSWNHPHAIATRFRKGEQRGKKYWFIKGFIPWNKGIKRLEITGINNPRYGIHFDHTKEAKNKIKKASLKMWEKVSAEERSKRFLKQWENMSDESLFKYFKAKIFDKNYKPNELDKKAIKANILIHKIRRSLNVD